MFSPYLLNHWMGKWLSILPSLSGAVELGLWKPHLLSWESASIWDWGLGGVDSQMQAWVCDTSTEREGWFARRGGLEPGRARRGVTRKAVQRITDYGRQRNQHDGNQAEIRDGKKSSFVSNSVDKHRQPEAEMGQGLCMKEANWSEKAARPEAAEARCPGWEFFVWWEFSLMKTPTRSPGSSGAAGLSHHREVGSSLFQARCRPQTTTERQRPQGACGRGRNL